jgi:tRNA-2-methylthio-N6-dimethylallyladenosine synthase
VGVQVTHAAPHHLVADGAAPVVRRTRAGDAWEKRQAGDGHEHGGSGDACGTGTPAGVVSLGLPSTRR